jgi:colicin import membrane protein
MFPFRKPKPTRAELLKQSVAGGVNTLLEYVPAEKLETVTHRAKDFAHYAGEIASEKLHTATDTMAHTLHDVADRVREASAHAADVAPDKFAAGADMAREKATALRGTAVVVGGKLAEQAAGKAHQAADTASVLAQAAREQAMAKLHQARERAAARAEEARLAALEAAEDYRAAASEAAEDTRDRLSAKREEWMESAAEKREELADQAEETKSNLLASAAELFADWKSRAADAADDIELPQLRKEPAEVEIKESGSKLLWILAGVAIGALVLLFVLPATRRRAKSMVKDRVKQIKEGAADAATLASDKAHDLRNRAEGLANTLDKKLHSDSTSEDDVTLADRVRSELGHLDLVKDLERLNVNAEFGTVTLRGPVMDEETQAAIEKAVRAIPGVKEVKSEFLIEEPEPADASSYAQ